MYGRYYRLKNAMGIFKLKHRDTTVVPVYRATKLKSQNTKIPTNPGFQF